MSASWPGGQVAFGTFSSAHLEVTATIPLGRVGQPDEIATWVLSLVNGP